MNKLAKPKVFAASSSGATKMLKALAKVMEANGLEVHQWITPEGWGSYPFPDLLETASKCHYAVCIMWADDELKKPKPKTGATHVPRDNVVFEAGLFSGVLNKDLWRQPIKDEKRVFYWVNNKHEALLHMPTDLSGLNQQRYDFDGNIEDPNLIIDELATIIEGAAQQLSKAIRLNWESATKVRSIQPLEKTFLSCFKREWITPLPNHLPLEFKAKSVLYDTDDVYDSLVNEAGASNVGVVAVDKDSRWIWDLFPVVLYWRLRAVPVVVIASRSLDSEELKRRQLLIGLGCSIIETDVRDRFFVLNPGAGVNTVVFKYENQKHCCATRISRHSEGAAVREVDGHLVRYGYSSPAGAAYTPMIVAASEADVIEKLKSPNGPSAYTPPDVSMRMEDVAVSSAYSISMSARTYRFRQISLLVQIFKTAGISLFEPAAVVLADGTKSLITPPVVEVNKDGHYVFIEGNTRALHSLCSGVTSIRALVVRNVSMKPPADEVPLNAVFLCRLKLPAAWRQLNWDYDAFRNIEAAIHNF
jgi:predicted nucleotide-binding protein